MDMSGMEGMGGMDSGMSGMFPENLVYAREYWYIIVAVVASFMTIRVGRFVYSRLSVRRIRLEPRAVPSKPNNLFTQTIATTTAILRESTYWQPWSLKGRFSQFFTPPSAGRCMILALYWLTILVMLFQNSILQPDDPMYAYKWEKMGYRAAWINVTQIPFLYLSATKLNPISILSGISYERLNWIHRWASRTVFVTVIFHWAYFYTEWSLADMVALELEMMPMVIYGFIAWGILGWQVLSSFGFFRNICYELWVLQHLAGAGVLLWALYMHVPSYAQYNIWLSVAFVAFDQIGRMIWNVIQNVGLLRRGPNGMSFGYIATLEALPDGYTSVRIPNVHFTWKAGQHIYLSIPRIGPVEAHPFTIANDQSYNSENGARTIALLIKAHAGFSRRIHNAARRSPSKTYRAFVSGPWGNPPDLRSYETIIFIANSTGATYNLPLFQQLSRTKNCARNVVFSWVCKESCQISRFQRQILDASEEITANGAKVSVRIGCTGGNTPEVCCCSSSTPAAASPPIITEILSDNFLAETSPRQGNEKSSCCQTSTSDIPAESKTLLATVTEKSSIPSSSSSAASSDSLMLASGNDQAACTCICALRNNSMTDFSDSRPSLDSIILPAVEAARGETAIVCCGRRSLMAEVRNYVASLSDERAVHKGSGAQGIFLWCEEFGW